MKENLKSDKSDKFIDIKEKGKKSKEKGASKTVQLREVDKLSQTLLKDLKDKKISKVLDKSNIYSYDIKWASNKNERETSLTHVEFLSKLCQDFYLVIKRRISDGIKERDASDFKENDKDNVFEEATQHIALCQWKTMDFHGRETLLARIRAYLTNTCSSPLVLYGGSGCGKSSVVGVAAKHVRSWVSREAIVVLRFLGTSPDSSSLRLVLRSICLQLCRAFGVNCNFVPQVTIDTFP